jgi:hypothetical protein
LLVDLIEFHLHDKLHDPLCLGIGEELFRKANKLSSDDFEDIIDFLRMAGEQTDEVIE